MADLRDFETARVYRTDRQTWIDGGYNPIAHSPIIDGRYMLVLTCNYNYYQCRIYIWNLTTDKYTALNEPATIKERIGGLDVDDYFRKQIDRFTRKGESNDNDRQKI